MLLIIDLYGICAFVASFAVPLIASKVSSGELSGRLRSKIQCPPFTFLSSDGTNFRCLPCSYCQADEFILLPCSVLRNTVCRPCRWTPSLMTRDYTLKCLGAFRYASKKRHWKRSNTNLEATSGPDKVPSEDGPGYTVIDSPDDGEKMGPKVAAPAPVPDPANPADADEPNEKGSDKTVFIYIGVAVLVVLIILAIGLILGKRRGLFDRKRKRKKKLATDVEESILEGKNQVNCSKKAPLGDLGEDQEPLVFPEIGPNPVMSFPVSRGRVNIPNGTLDLADGPGVRPFGSESFPFIDEDVSDDDKFPDGLSKVCDHRTKSLGRGSKSPSPVGQFNSLPVNLSPASLKSYSQPNDAERSPSVDSGTSNSSSYSLHSRRCDSDNANEHDLSEETSPLLKSGTKYVSTSEKEQLHPSGAAPLMSSSPSVVHPDEKYNDSPAISDSPSSEEDNATPYYGREPAEALILDDEVEPRTMTELERQFNRMAADWEAFGHDNPGMGTCMIFEDQSLETIPESPEFSYRSDTDDTSSRSSVVSVDASCAYVDDSKSSGEASITQSTERSVCSSRSSTPDIDVIGTNSNRQCDPLLHSPENFELDSNPSVSDCDHTNLKEESGSIGSKTGAPSAPLLVSRESETGAYQMTRARASSNLASDTSCASTFSDIQHYLGSSDDDDIFIPHADEHSRPRNETITSADLDQQLSSIPAFEEPADGDPQIDPFHSEGPDITSQNIAQNINNLHILDLESPSSSSESSSEESSSDDLVTPDGVGLVFENKMAFR